MTKTMTKAQLYDNIKALHKQGQECYQLVKETHCQLSRVLEYGFNLAIGNYLSYYEKWFDALLRTNKRLADIVELKGVKYVTKVELQDWYNGTKTMVDEIRKDTDSIVMEMIKGFHAYANPSGDCILAHEGAAVAFELVTVFKRLGVYYNYGIDVDVELDNYLHDAEPYERECSGRVAYRRTIVALEDAAAKRTGIKHY